METKSAKFITGSIYRLIGVINIIQFTLYAIAFVAPTARICLFMSDPLVMALLMYDSTIQYILKTI